MSFFIDSNVLEITGNDTVFARLISLEKEIDCDKEKIRWNNLCCGLTAFLQLHPSSVVNRPFSACHNGNKPLHESLLSGYGLRVPDSLTSSNPKSLRDFCEEGAAIVKTLCGIRANCRAVDSEMFWGDSFDGPVHLQRRIYGNDVRIHAVGDNCFGLEIENSAVDYRHTEAKLKYKSVTIPSPLGKLIVDTSASLDLELSGWDFKVDHDGNFWCLEVNSMPGYSGYDIELNGAISRALVSALKS